jgi:hypothetical protein
MERPEGAEIAAQRARAWRKGSQALDHWHLYCNHTNVLGSNRTGWRRAGGLVVAVAALHVAPAARADDAPCTETWHETGAKSFPLPKGLTRSQGVATEGEGWIFSWQGGLERTNDRYATKRRNPVAWPIGVAVDPAISADGTNHIGGNHIGDIDVFEGKVYAPVEDGGQGPFNDPEYQKPYIALYDAKSLLYTGRAYALPLELHEAGVPWVAINPVTREVYTGEWDMPHDRINVFDLQMHFKRFIALHDSSTGDAHVSRIQGAKVFDGALYGSRDDSTKSVVRIDLDTGEVTKLFSLGLNGEMEGLAFRSTPDGAQMHIVFIHDNDDYTKIRSSLHHFKRTITCV